jgi:membrane-bound lytic murein transglycosylase A
MSEPVYQRNPPLLWDPRVSSSAVASAPLRASAVTGKKTAGSAQPAYRGWRYVVATAGMGILLFGLTAEYGNSAEWPKPRELVTRAVKRDEASTPQLEPLKVPDSQLEPIAWSGLERWTADDHSLAFTTFLASCRPLLRSSPANRETRPMYFALKHVCRRALDAGRLAKEQARLFFERNFRPLRIAKLGDNAGLLTGYYEPIVDGSRFPTPIFKVPIYRRPPDLVPPVNSTGLGFPNKGQSLRRTGSGELVPYYDRGEILDGALDGQHLEICWIKHQADVLLIQIEGSARVRLEDGTMLRINYDAHNGYPFVPVSRILIERNIIPRHEMSLERIREWMRANPVDAEKIWRQNRSFVFFRIVGLSDDREAVGAEGIPLTPGRSIAIDPLLHVYGTPFFLQAGRLLTAGNQSIRFDRLMIAQDTGSAIVGPARADIFWGAGEQAGRLAGGLQHPATFAMLVPREVDPVAAGARMPLPPEKPPLTGEANARTSLPKPATLVQAHRFGQADEFRRNLRPQSRQQSGCSGTSDPGQTPPFGRTVPNRHVRSASPLAAGADCGPSAKAAHAKEVAKRALSGFAPSTERKHLVTWHREN